MEDHGHKELKNTFSFMGNINDELWYLFLPPPLYHCTATGLESANCLLEYIATISFYGKPTPKMICLNYKLHTTGKTKWGNRIQIFKIMFKGWHSHPSSTYEMWVGTWQWGASPSQPARCGGFSPPSWSHSPPATPWSINCTGVMEYHI